MKKSNQPVFNSNLNNLQKIIDKHTQSDSAIGHLVRPNIRSLKPYSSARHEFKGTAKVYLDANENPFNNGMNRYPDPMQWKVKEPLAEIKGVQPENIFLGNGSDEPIDLLMRIFCEPGVDNIITLPPTYGMYQVSADINNVAIKKVPLTSDFQLDVAAILSAADDHSKLLFICSPNNPTGNRMDRSDIESLIKDFRGIVVIDEAYIDFSSEETGIPFIYEYPNVVILQTFSKAWGMANIRLGQAYAPVEIINLLNKVKPPYNIGELAQKAALLAFRHRDTVKENVETILKQRSRLEDRLTRFPFIEEVHPSDANFLLAKVQKPQPLYDFLVTRGIIVRDRSTVTGCTDCLRFTVGQPKENDALIKALERWETVREKMIV